jgi:DNA-binding LytR/AlgR family response regulator
MKPFKEEKVYHIVEKALEIIDEEQKRYITLKTKDGISKIDIAHLCYVESDGKYLNFTDEEGNQYRTIMTMDEAGSLAGEKLTRCHRCYYVNLNKAERIFEKNIIYKDGKVIPISRNHYKNVYHKFMDTFEKYWE